MSKDFYTDIAAFYNEIFPLNRAMLNFVLKSSGDTSNKSILDIGCGSGTLIYALKDYFSSLLGLEPDSAMLELAKEQLPSDCQQIKFYQGGMLNICHFAAHNSIDVAIIVGNTLVHLENLAQIQDCLAQIHAVLRSQGIFIFQIINYDRIFRTNEFFLPTIQTENCHFERIYERIPHDDRLSFYTKLHVNMSGQVLENRVPLYPLRFSDLQQCLRMTGFTEVDYFANFAGEPWHQDAMPLIGVARK